MRGSVFMAQDGELMEARSRWYAGRMIRQGTIETTLKKQNREEKYNRKEKIVSVERKRLTYGKNI